MPNHYVEDYEEVIGQKKPVAAKPVGFSGKVEAKVVAAPKKSKPASAKVAETK